MTMQDRERDRRSLQDLAKMAQGGLLTPPPPSVKAPTSSAPSGVQRAAEAKADDSGVVDLALAAQSDPGGAVRAKSTPLAQDGLFDDEPASVRPGPISTGAAAQFQQPAPSIPPFSQPPSVAPLSQPIAPVSAAAPASIAAPTPITAAPKKKGGGKGIVFALTGIIALGAVAAGGFFVFKGIQAKRAAEAAFAAAAKQPALPATVAAAPDTKPADPAPAPESTVDPNALPTAEPANAKVASNAKATPPTGKPQPLAMNAPAPKPEGPAKISEKDIPTTAAGPEGDLGKAMGKAVGADGKPVEQTPASGNTGPQFAAGTVPQKPSQGAVTGALGAVLPGARGCLGPDDPISRASVTFASAGNVTSVSVSGGAAGKPAEACIKGALQKAKLTPFMEPSYTANVTIRHN